jgi:hypothetical protein
LARIGDRVFDDLRRLRRLARRIRRIFARRLMRIGIVDG